MVHGGAPYGGFHLVDATGAGELDVAVDRGELAVVAHESAQAPHLGRCGEQDQVPTIALATEERGGQGDGLDRHLGIRGRIGQLRAEGAVPVLDGRQQPRRAHRREVVEGGVQRGGRPVQRGPERRDLLEVQHAVVEPQLLQIGVDQRVGSRGRELGALLGRDRQRIHVLTDHGHGRRGRHPGGPEGVGGVPERPLGLAEQGRGLARVAGFGGPQAGAGPVDALLEGRALPDGDHHGQGGARERADGDDDGSDRETAAHGGLAAPEARHEHRDDRGHGHGGGQTHGAPTPVGGTAPGRRGRPPRRR